MVKFKDYPDFTPELTPKQMFQSGVFGGTYFRDIYSGITKKKYTNAWKEFPAEWFKGLDIKKHVSSNVCDVSVNKYKVKSGSSLKDWELKGWIKEQDPYGWVQWYCRFYQGRRSSDDQRQIQRWKSIVGPNGRFRKMLLGILDRGNESSKIRQLMLQWAC